MKCISIYLSVLLFIPFMEFDFATENIKRTGRPITVLKTMDELIKAGYFRCDYTYFPKAEGWFKLHPEPKFYDQAKEWCSAEGGNLVTTETEEIKDAVLSLIGNDGTITAVHIDMKVVHFGNANEYSEIRENDVYYNEPGAPQKANQNITILTKDGTYQNVHFGEQYPFICHKSRKETQKLNQCGTLDNEYTLDSRTGNCYKFHRNRATWLDAFGTCKSEGGKLAIINSETEAQVIRDVFERNPSDSIPGYTWTDSAFLGFYFTEAKWRTVYNGETLPEAGYSKWSTGEPNNARGDEYCGSVGRNGLLFDDPCLRSLPFICEIKPFIDILMCSDEQTQNFSPVKNIRVVYAINETGTIPPFRQRLVINQISED